MAGRPPGTTDSADHELSASSLPGIEVRAASVRGLLHRYREQPRQDRFSLAHDPASDTLVITVCDGVGSLPLSHEAAAFVTRAMPSEYLACGDWSVAIREVNEQLTAFAKQAADMAAETDDPDACAMATTFVGVALSPGAETRTASIAWTDDSTVWLLDGSDWTNLTADTGAEDGTMHQVGVRALPHREPRFRTAQVEAEHGALFVLTDGVGVPLEGASEVRQTLAQWWASPPDIFTFGSQVAFARKAHMDDRTAVGVWFGAKD
jgi:hypothetical protein